ncbi:hypothetical protein [Staphylococcus haemolyticus]|nr:hypothetical protein [Staphylococcus haemolyticus]
MLRLTDQEELPLFNPLKTEPMQRNNQAEGNNGHSPITQGDDVARK